MIKKFFKSNKDAIKTGFKWTSLIFTCIVLIIFSIGLIKNQKPDLGLFITVVLSASIGFPIFIIIVGFLRWSWDYSITHRNLDSFPFSQLETIGFRNVTKNEDSKTRFTSDYYTGTVNGFIVDCDVDTQNDSKHIRFKYYINIRPLGKTDFKRIQKDFEEFNGYFDFNWISKKYHYKKHRIKSVTELEKELIDFGEMILKEKIEPCEDAKR